MNETQLLSLQMLIQVSIIQEIIATEDIKENTTGTQNEENLIHTAKLADFHFR